MALIYVKVKSDVSIACFCTALQLVCQKKSIHIQPITKSSSDLVSIVVLYVCSLTECIYNYLE